MGEPAFGVWLPIETAPEDRDWVLLYQSGADEPVCFVGRRGIFGGWQNQEGVSVMPSHWMRLPAPPAPERAR